MMTSKIRKVVLGFTIFAIAINFTGCVAMIQNAVVDAFPTFEATENSWPALSPNMGRVVIYWPREGLGSGNSVQLTIFGKKSTMSSIGNQTFVFADLPAETYDFEIANPGWTLFNPKQTLSVSVQSGQIIYVKINGLSNPLRVMEATEAREELKKIHHNYKRPLPISGQPKHARPAM